MGRDKYRNGDELKSAFGSCDGCSPSIINGVFCHEQGCPDAWKDRKVICDECGETFYPIEYYQSVCTDCQNNWDGYYDLSVDDICDECDAEFNGEFEDDGSEYF